MYNSGYDGDGSATERVSIFGQTQSGITPTWGPGGAKVNLEIALKYLNQVRDSENDSPFLPDSDSQTLDALRKFVIKALKTDSQKLTEYQFQELKRLIAAVNQKPIQSDVGRWAYRIVIALIMIAFAATGIPGVAKVLANTLADASVGFSLAVKTAGYVCGYAVQFASVYEMHHVFGPLRLGCSNLGITKKTGGKVTYLMREGDEYRSQWLISKPIQFTIASITALANSVLTLGVNDLISGTTPSYMNMFWAAASFPGSLILFVYAQRYFTTNAFPSLMGTGKEIFNFFYKFGENRNFLIKLGLIIPGTIAITGYGILAIALAVIAQLVTFGFVGAIGEVILTLVRLISENDYVGINLILASYSSGILGALPLTLIFVAGLLTIALKIGSGAASLLKRDEIDNDTVKKSIAQHLSTAIEVFGMLVLSFFAALNSPGNAIPAIQTLLGYFSIMLSEENAYSLQLGLVLASTLTNGRFAVNSYNIIKELSNTITAEVAYQHFLNYFCRDKNKASTTNNALVISEHPAENVQGFTFANALTWGGRGAGTFAAGTMVYSAVKIISTEIGKVPDTVSERLASIAVQTLKEISTTIPTAAFYAFFISFMLGIFCFFLYPILFGSNNKKDDTSLWII